MSKFRLGQVVTSQDVTLEMSNNIHFATFVAECLERHSMGDWGNVCDEDKKQNNLGIVQDRERMLLSAYTIDSTKGKSEGFGENTLWIITEWDRSVTTILFPSEY